MAAQPPVHELVACVQAPTAVLSDRAGDIRPGGAQGAFTGDVRVLSTAVLSLGEDRLQPAGWWLDGPSGATFATVVPAFGPAAHDPAGEVRRERRTTQDGLGERITLTSYVDRAIEVRMELTLGVDLARVHAVKNGDPPPEALPAKASGDRLTWTGSGPGDRAFVVEAELPGARLEADPAGVRAVWPVRLAARGSVTITWALTVQDPGRIVRRPGAPAPWSVPTVTCDDPRLRSLVSRSLDDLDALRLESVDQPGAQFAAAGSPWYLTLFGRDSLWTARMLLPLGVGLAEGTLEVLAARQGRSTDVSSAEAPGKILHEVRRAATLHGAFGSMDLPPVYYGTVDATPLWVLLLHDAWSWGLPDDRVERLLPHLERAMGWVAGDGDPDGDGFLEYVDASGRGLANQGWKDSADAVRFRDGTIADGPIALAEVQGYAHEAALAAATLLEAFGRPGADAWREWAGRLAARFRAAYWVEDERGRYPALALDGAKRPVDSVTSNIGHLLGTGLLSAAEAALVAGRLADDLDTGLGLRTMSGAAGGYSPLSYHCGSVWPHDTAIVALGLAREGFGDQAARLAAGLVEAAQAFGWRLPELYGGAPAVTTPAPVPYPPSCHPQAWAAAAGVAVLQVLAGVSVGAPGRLRVDPPPGMPLGGLAVAGLRHDGADVSVQISREGTVLASHPADPGE